MKHLPPTIHHSLIALSLQILHAFCGESIASAAIIWAAATGFGICIIVLASAASSLAFIHPGDVETEDHKPLVDDTDSYIDMTYGANPQAKRQMRPGNAYRYSSVPRM